MSFMQRQVTANCEWLRVETTQGTWFLNRSECGLWVRNSDCEAQPLTDVEHDSYAKEIQQYVEGIPQSWENIKGYGARLSAPGYLDCTEWCVFDTEEEANKYLDDEYPEDEEEANNE